jgi:hypothetical protein
MTSSPGDSAEPGERGSTGPPWERAGPPGEPGDLAGQTMVGAPVDEGPADGAARPGDTAQLDRVGEATDPDLAGGFAGTGESGPREDSTAEFATAGAGAAQTGGEETSAELGSAAEAGAAGTDREEARAEAASAAEAGPAEADGEEISTGEASPQEASTAEASTAEASTAEASTAEASTAEASTAEASTGEASTEEDGAADAGTVEAGTGEEAAGAEAEGETVTSPPRHRRRSWVRARTSALVSQVRSAAARAGAVVQAYSGPGFSRLTLLPTLLVTAWLLPAVPLLLAGSFALAPMLVISIPVALALVVFGLRKVPKSWPKSAQARSGPGDQAPWWALLGTVVVAAGFTVWQILMSAHQVIVTRDPGVYLQFGYWIAQHGSVHIPASASAFGGAHPGLGFSSVGFVQHGSTLSPQFLAGLPSVLAAGFWAGGTSAAVLVPAVLGGLAVLTFAGLVGRLAGPRWAPAGAIVLALALPEQYTSRSAFSETLTQILLFGGLCLLIDSLCSPTVRNMAARLRDPEISRPWWAWWEWRPAGPSPAAILAVLGGLALGLTAVIGVGGLSDLLPAIPLIGVMFAARKPQWLPFGIGLVVGAGYGLADGYLLARPYLDTLSSWTRPFGITIGALAVITLDCALIWRYAKLGRWSRHVLSMLPLRWLPEAVAALTVAVVIGFAVRPYVQTVRGDTNPGEISYVGYLQRVAGLPLDAHRLYAEDTLYWVIWYIGLPALLLGVFGVALLARRVLRALITWNDPGGATRLWALPLLIIGWVTVTVLWRPGTVPDQPWASRRLVPIVLPGLILAAVWAAAWLNGRARVRGAGKGASSAVAVLCVGALLLPTTLTTFGIGVASSARTKAKSTGLAFQRTGKGEITAVHNLCAAIGPGAAVVIIDPRVANEFTQLIRGMCNVPVARMNRPSPLALQPVTTGIEQGRRRPVLLGATMGELGAYGAPPREVLNLTTTQDAHELTRPPTTTWTAKYTIWMSQPG